MTEWRVTWQDIILQLPLPCFAKYINCPTIFIISRTNVGEFFNINSKSENKKKDKKIISSNFVLSILHLYTIKGKIDFVPFRSVSCGRAILEKWACRRALALMLYGKHKGLSLFFSFSCGNSLINWKHKIMLIRFKIYNKILIFSNFIPTLSGCLNCQCFVIKFRIKPELVQCKLSHMT